MSVGRPRGSFNRWKYDEVYHPATPPSGNVARQAAGSRDTGYRDAGSWDAGSRDTGSRDAGVMQNNDSHYHRWRQGQRLRTYTTTPPPTPGRRVEQEAKRDVDWAYDTLSFYLRVSNTLLHTSVLVTVKFL